MSSTWRCPHSTQNGAGRSSGGVGVGEAEGEASTIVSTAVSTAVGDATAGAAAATSCAADGTGADVLFSSFVTLTLAALSFAEAFAVADVKVARVTRCALPRRSVRRMPEVVAAPEFVAPRRVEMPARCSWAAVTVGLGFTFPPFAVGLIASAGNAVARECALNARVPALLCGPPLCSADTAGVGRAAAVAPTGVPAAVLLMAALLAGVAGGAGAPAAAAADADAGASEAVSMIGFRACTSVVDEPVAVTAVVW